ncbi:MAG: hypothetical protein ACREJO_00105 [Phycisphaerales bacterium]
MQQNKAIKKHNEAIAAGARNQMVGIDQNIQSARRSFYDQTSISSAQARGGVATLQNNQGFASGQSIDSYVSQIMADQNVDQLARSTQLADSITAAQTQKETIAASARSGMSSGASPLLAGIQGGLQGASMGMSLNSAIDNFNRVSTVNTALSGLAPLAAAGDPQAIAQMQAINAGISPELATMNNSPFARPYLMQNALMDMQLQGAMQQYGASGLRLDSINNQLRMIQDPLRQYQNWGR